MIVLSSRGGQYAGTPFEAAMDHQEAYLRAVFSFFGLPEIEIVRAERLAMDHDASLEAAKASLDELLEAAVA